MPTTVEEILAAHREREARKAEQARRRDEKLAKLSQLGAAQQVLRNHQGDNESLMRAVIEFFRVAKNLDAAKYLHNYREGASQARLAVAIAEASSAENAALGLEIMALADKEGESYRRGVDYALTFEMPNCIYQCFEVPPVERPTAAKQADPQTTNAAPGSAAAAETVPAEPTPAPEKKGVTRRRVNRDEANGAMIHAIIEHPERMSWSARKWARFVKCSTSTIHATKAWTEFAAARESAKRDREQPRTTNRRSRNYIEVQ